MVLAQKAVEALPASPLDVIQATVAACLSTSRSSRQAQSLFLKRLYEDGSLRAAIAEMFIPIAGAEAEHEMSSDQTAGASAPATESEASGQKPPFGDDHTARAAASLPANVEPIRVRTKPGHAARRFDVMATAAAVSNAALLDELVIDGVSFGDWKRGAAEAYGLRMTIEGRMLLAACRHAANAPADAKLRDIITNEDAQRFLAEAKAALDVVA